MKHLTEQQKLENLYSTGLSLFSNGLPSLIPRNRSNSISSNPRDYSFISTPPPTEKYTGKSNFDTTSQVFNHQNNNNGEFNFERGQFTTSTSSYYGPFPTSSTSLNDSLPFTFASNSDLLQFQCGYNRYNKHSNNESTVQPISQSQLDYLNNEYEFPPKSNKSTSPTILYSQSLLLSPIDQTRRNSLDYFTLNSNISAQRQTYSHFDEEPEDLTDDFLTPKCRSTESLDTRGRKWSITSTGGGGGGGGGFAQTPTSSPQSNQRNYYNGGIGRDHRKSSLGDETILPNIGRRGSTISLASSSSSSNNSKSLIPQLLLQSSPGSSNFSSSSSSSNHSSITTGSTRSSSSGIIRSISPTPLPEIAKAKRLKSSISSSSPPPPPLILSPPSSSSSTTANRSARAARRSTSSSSTRSPPIITDSNGSSSSNGGAGSSKGPRSFSPSEQNRLWGLWDAGEFYPSHDLVTELVKETDLNRGQIRGWFANRRFRATEEEKLGIARSRAATNNLGGSSGERS